MHIMKFRMVQKLCEYRRISIKESQVGAFISTDRLSVDKLIEMKMNLKFYDKQY